MKVLIMSKSNRNSLFFTLMTVVLVVGGYIGGQYIFPGAQFARAQEKVESTRQQLASLEDFSTVFRHVAVVVEPSVVNVDVKKKSRVTARTPMDEDLLRRFFPDRDGDGEPDVPEGFGQGLPEPSEPSGTGSGVIMDVDGGDAYIITNNHVAGDADEIVVTLADGRRITEATLIGTDPKSDVAVIRIKADRVIAAKWGDSDSLQRGDWVLAFGSPLGYAGTMTAGIVSALNRQTNASGGGILGPNGYENFIQTDAAINPGNSGGPLVDIHGSVIGINTAIATRSGGFQGIGFAIPSNQAHAVYDQLRKSGKVVRGWIGVRISDVAQNLPMAKSFGYDKQVGVLVEQTMANTPATGKLQAGDIITKIGDTALENVQQLRNTVAMTAPGTTVKLTVFRDKELKAIDLIIGEQPEDLAVANEGTAPIRPQTGQAESLADLGVQLRDITPAAAEKFGLGEVSTGALVVAVEQRSPAALAGIRPGDLITRVGEKEVTDAKAAVSALKDVDLSKGIRLYVVSREVARFVFIQKAGR